MNYYENEQKVRKGAWVYIFIGAPVFFITLAVLINCLANDPASQPPVVWIFIPLLLVVGIVSFVYAYQDFTRPPRLLICVQPGGVIFYIAGEETPLLTWNELERVEPYSGGINHIIVIVPKHPGAYIQSLTAKQKKEIEMVRNSSRAEISMLTTACDTPNTQIAEYINGCIKSTAAYGI